MRFIEDTRENILGLKYTCCHVWKGRNVRFRRPIKFKTTWLVGLESLPYTSMPLLLWTYLDGGKTVCYELDPSTSVCPLGGFDHMKA